MSVKKSKGEESEGEIKPVPELFYFFSYFLHKSRMLPVFKAQSMFVVSVFPVDDIVCKQTPTPVCF